MFHKLDKFRGAEVFVDADFARAWAVENILCPNSVLSRTGHVVCIFGCSFYWQSKLQTEIALSTTEAEHVALSQSLRNVMPLTNISNESHQALNYQPESPIIKCTIFEDNQSTIAVVKSPTMLPRTKHISLKHHHLR